MCIICVFYCLNQTILKFKKRSYIINLSWNQLSWTRFCPDVDIFRDYSGDHISRSYSGALTLSCRLLLLPDRQSNTRLQVFTARERRWYRSDDMNTNMCRFRSDAVTLRSNSWARKRCFTAESRRKERTRLFLRLLEMRKKKMSLGRRGRRRRRRGAAPACGRLPRCGDRRLAAVINCSQMFLLFLFCCVSRLGSQISSLQ